MIHCEDPMKIGLDQNFPISIEVQLLGGNGIDERTTANLCTSGTNVEIDVRNNSIIKHFIKGEEVMRYNKPQFVEET